jgi:O-methyltransferase
MRPDFSYAFHPLLPARLGFRRLLAWINPKLAHILDKTDDFTLVPARSRVTLARVVQQVLDADIPGDFAEFGVHRGGTAAVMASLLPVVPRTLHLFDRWGDLPEPTDEDGQQKQRYARANIAEKLKSLVDKPPLEAARKLMGRTWLGQARYYQGWYEDTLPTYDGAPIACAFVDCDYYESVRLVLDFIRQKAAPGCVILIDDYGDQWPGARQATDEFCAAHNLQPEVILSQAIVRL